MENLRMNTILLVTFFSFTIFLHSCHGVRIGPIEPKTTTFIKTSCSATTYPTLCFNSLSSYASTIQNSPMQLASTALSVSLAGARSTSTMVSKMSTAGTMSPRVASAMKDCMENLGNSASELQESLDELGHLKGTNIGFQMNSIQTWVSAALTDDDTCMDGFQSSATNGNVKDMVRSHVVNVAQLTSNALALVNSLASSMSP